MKKKLFITILCIQLITIPIENLTSFAMFSKTASAAVQIYNHTLITLAINTNLKKVKPGKGYGHTHITDGKNHIGRLYKNFQSCQLCCHKQSMNKKTGLLLK